MGFIFNADEIYEIALQIERNGAKFYAESAANITDPRVKELLTTLAEVEIKHQIVFESMRDEYIKTGKQVNPFDPDGEAGLYLQAMASGHVFDFKNDLKKITPDSTLKEILLFSLAREKDSIVFYLGMQEMVPDSLGKGQLNWIIKEEMKHVTFISKELNRLG